MSTINWQNPRFLAILPLRVEAACLPPFEATQ